MGVNTSEHLRFIGPADSLILPLPAIPRPIAVYLEPYIVNDLLLCNVEDGSGEGLSGVVSSLEHCCNCVTSIIS